MYIITPAPIVTIATLAPTHTTLPTHGLRYQGVSGTSDTSVWGRVFGTSDTDVWGRVSRTLYVKETALPCLQASIASLRPVRFFIMKICGSKISFNILW